MQLQLEDLLYQNKAIQSADENFLKVKAEKCV